jgi:hypothetical protein
MCLNWEIEDVNALTKELKLTKPKTSTKHVNDRSLVLVGCTSIEPGVN